MKLFITWVTLLAMSCITSTFFTIIMSLTSYESLGLMMVIFFLSLLYIINKFEIV